MKQYRVWFSNGSAQVLKAKDPAAAAKAACLLVGRPGAEVQVEELPGKEDVTENVE